MYVVLFPVAGLALNGVGWYLGRADLQVIGVVVTITGIWLAARNLRRNRRS